MTFEMEVVRFDAQDVIATSGLLELPVGPAHSEHSENNHIYVLGYDGDDLKVAWYKTVNGDLALDTEFKPGGISTVSSTNAETLSAGIGKWFYHTGNWKWTLDDSLNGQ